MKNNNPTDNLIERLSKDGGVILGRIYSFDLLPLLFKFFIFDKSGKSLLMSLLICFSFLDAFWASKLTFPDCLAFKLPINNWSKDDSIFALSSRSSPASLTLRSLAFCISSKSAPSSTPNIS